MFPTPAGGDSSTGPGAPNEPTQHAGYPRIGNVDYPSIGAVPGDATQMSPRATAPPSTPPAYPSYPSYPPAHPGRPAGGLQPQHWAVLAVCAVAVIAIVVITGVLLSRGDDEEATSSSTSKRRTDSAPVAVDDLTPCSSAPTAEADAVSYGPDGLTIRTTLSSGCSGGDLLSNDRFRLTAVDSAGRDVAAGVFNLANTPVALPADGDAASVSFTFPAGTYWRTGEATSGSLTLTAHRDGSDASAAAGSSSASSVTAFDVGTPEQGSLDAAAFSALADIVAADRPYIDANLVNVWQPQLSSKRPGLYYDGITWQANDIVKEHMQLRQKYPDARMVWSGDWPVYKIKDWWITVSGVSMPSGEAANDWCAREGYDADHCFAKMLSHSMGESGTTLNRR